MAYLKYGIVVKIKLVKNKSNGYDYIRRTINLDYYNKTNNTFHLKLDILNNNIKAFRKEFLKYTNNYGDSIDNCEAYCLNIDVNKLIESEIIFSSNYESYYFKDYNTLKFNPDIVEISNKKITIKLYLLPIYWDIYSIKAEDFSKTSLLLNNFTQKALKNPLKDVSLFTLV